MNIRISADELRDILYSGDLKGWCTECGQPQDRVVLQKARKEYCTCCSKYAVWHVVELAIDGWFEVVHNEQGKKDSY